MPFLSNSDLFCSSLCLADTCKLLIDLSCRLSLLGICTVRGSGCSLPAAFLFLCKGAGGCTREASIVSKNGGQRAEAEFCSFFFRKWPPPVKIQWTSSGARRINNFLAVSSKFMNLNKALLSVSAPIESAKGSTTVLSVAL